MLPEAEFPFEPGTRLMDRAPCHANPHVQENYRNVLDANGTRRNRPTSPYSLR